MKVLIVALLVMSCAHSYSHVTGTGATIRLCSLPELVVIGSDVPKEYHSTIVSGLKYWNEAVGKQVFFDMGKVDFTAYSDESNAFLTVSVMNEAVTETIPYRNHTRATTQFRYNTSSGCIDRVKMLINPNSLDGDLDRFETTVRHELGHALGLEHSPTFTDIMSIAPSSERTMQHPIDASDEEVAAVRAIYH